MTRLGRADTNILLRGHGTDARSRDGRGQWTYTIFEGTSEIQRLIISRAITGLHIQ